VLRRGDKGDRDQLRAVSPSATGRRIASFTAWRPASQQCGRPNVHVAHRFCAESDAAMDASTRRTCRSDTPTSAAMSAGLTFGRSTRSRSTASAVRARRSTDRVRSGPSSPRPGCGSGSGEPAVVSPATASVRDLRLDIGKSRCPPWVARREQLEVTETESRDTSL
jgi:hypothetical protein